MNIPGFTGLEGRRFTDVASLVIVDKIEVQFLGDNRKDLESLIRHIMADLQAQMIRSFRDPKSGRTYLRPKQRRRRTKGGGEPEILFETYTASAPGEAPAIRTGRLARSVETGVTFPDPLEADLTIDTGYETFLELGTRKMAARPYVIPAINEVLTKLEQSEVIDGFTGIDEFDIAA